MDLHILEEGEDLVCTKHMEKITMLILDKDVPFHETLLCQKCFETKSTICTKSISFTKVKQLIREKFESQKQDLELNLFLDNLKQFSTDLIEYKNKVIHTIQFMIGLIDEGIKNLLHPDYKPKSIYKSLQDLHLDQHDQSIEYTKRSIMKKLQIHFSKLPYLNELQKCSKYIVDDQSLTQKRVIKIQEVEQGLIIKPLLPFEQEEVCHAIAFNKQGSLMAAGSEQNIKLWHIEREKIIDLQTLIGHTQLINCLVFSKRVNWFVSGSSDSTIRGWKELVFMWSSTEPLKYHNEYISCIILNNNETELISSSGDQTINVWKVDCLTNKINYSYTFEKRHKEGINSMSLNQSETLLVSCSLDETIILWIKDYEWEYASYIKASDGNRICFISDTQILFQPKKLSQTQVFQIENNKLVHHRKLDINLNIAIDDLFLFPTIYNKQRQIIIEKHNRYVYIIKKQIDGNFKILETIDCQSWQNCGSLTENGEILAIWSAQTRQFRLYEICY